MTKWEEQTRTLRAAKEEGKNTRMKWTYYHRSCSFWKLGNANYVLLSIEFLKKSFILQEQAARNALIVKSYIHGLIYTV